MNKFRVLVFILIIPCFANAQQTPLLSHYFENLNIINPSTVGFSQGYEIKFNGRQQWSNFADSPIRNSSLSLSKAFGVNGVGLSVYTDNSGNLNHSGLSLKYAYKTLLSDKNHLFFGLAGGMVNRSINNISEYDYSNITFDNNWAPNASFGISFKRKDLIIGTSIEGLLESDFGFTEEENIFERHIFSFAKYSFKASETVLISPSALYKAPIRGNTQYEVNLNLSYKQSITFGVGYRGGFVKQNQFGPTINLGFNLGKISSLYSQDIVMNDVSGYSSGTSELSLKYVFQKEQKPENIKPMVLAVEKPDRDKDGVPDDEDECPDIFGSVEARGCPDFDRDGIPDSEDLCPNTLGEILNGGCPLLSREDSVIINNAIQNLEFSTDSDRIKESSYSALTNIAKLMLGNRNMMLIISGHTDSDASDEYNVNLSAKRAKSVKDFFEKRGVKKHRLVMDFHGESRPLYPNDSDFNKSKNRRVEFQITFM